MGIEITVKNNKFRSPFDKNVLRCQIYRKTLGFHTLHTDAHDRLDDISIHHKPHFHQITSVFKPSQNMVRSTEELFDIERKATRGLGAKKIATALGVPEATTKRWLLRLRSDGDMASRNIGRPRGAEAGLCVLFLVLPVPPRSNCHVCLASGPWLQKGARSCRSAHQHLDFC